MVEIGGLQKSSLIDFPQHICAVIFTQGCNFKCPYCHNPELIIEKADSNIIESALFKFLNSRKNKLDGVVITGGEPTLQKDLPEFIKKIKDMGFFVKLDTNGSNPQMLEKLIDEKLIDYVAMDIKAQIEKYSQIACAKINTKNILKSIEILKKSDIDFEFRTTVVKSQLEVTDFEKIGEMITGAKKYYLQRFVSTKTLDKLFMEQTTYSDEAFSLIIKHLKKNVKSVVLR